VATKKAISVYLVASTMFHDSDWLRDLGVKNPPKAEGPEGLIGLAAKRCYNSFEPGLNPNVTRVRSKWVDFFDNILASGHGSVLEHASFSFAIEGVTRVFTAEMNRHRAGTAISEGSLRYIRLDDISYWEPNSIKGRDPRCIETRNLFREAFNQAEAYQAKLREIWADDLESDFSRKKELTSMFRRLVPMGVSTGGVWSMNIRALRHMLAMRSSPHAEEEIAYVFSRIGKIVTKQAPLLFKDFKLVDGFWVPGYRKV
jgi:thymidylate synthase (FAD)